MTALALTFGLSSNTVKAEKRIFDPCLGAYVSTYQATVDQYGEDLAGDMAYAAWNACHDNL